MKLASNLFVFLSYAVIVIQGNEADKQRKLQNRPLNILLGNDDGFEAPYMLTMYTTLKAAGHNVIISAPYDNKSGTSSAIEVFLPYVTTSHALQGGTIPAGAPGVGPTTLGPNQYYVNGAVTSAALYGLDVLSPQIFGGKPDLVIGGPNIGQNLGYIGIVSGTVAYALSGVNKGIPGIAFSADSSEKNIPLMVDLCLKVVASIKRKSDGSLNFPKGFGLNINLPNTKGSSTVANFTFAKTRIGIASSIGLQFVSNLAVNCPAYKATGGNSTAPGLCIAVPYTSAGVIVDNDPLSEANALRGVNVVTISPMQSTFQASTTTSNLVFKSFNPLF